MIEKVKFFSKSLCDVRAKAPKCVKYVGICSKLVCVGGITLLGNWRVICRPFRVISQNYVDQYSSSSMPPPPPVPTLPLPFDSRTLIFFQHVLMLYHSVERWRHQSKCKMCWIIKNKRNLITAPGGFFELYLNVFIQ